MGKSDKIQELFARGYLHPGWNEKTGPTIAHFSSWTISGEEKIQILEAIEKGVPLKIQKSLFNDILTVLESIKEYFVKEAMAPYSSEILPDIGLGSIYARFTEPIEWIKAKLEEIVLLEMEDTRLVGNLSPREVEEYFMRLTQFYRPNDPQGISVQVLKPTEVRHFLHANFQGFSPMESPKLLETQHITKKELRRFMYMFYERFHKIQRTGPYVLLLKDNFKLFEQTKLESIQSNFSK